MPLIKSISDLRNKANEIIQGTVTSSSEAALLLPSALSLPLPHTSSSSSRSDAVWSQSTLRGRVQWSAP